MVLTELASAYVVAIILLAGYIILLRKISDDVYDGLGSKRAVYWAAKIFLTAVIIGILVVLAFIPSPQTLAGGIEPVFKSILGRVQAMQQLTGSLAAAIFLQNTMVAVLAATVPLGLGALDAYLRKNSVYSTVTRVLAAPIELAYRLTSGPAKTMTPDQRLTSLAVLAYPLIIMFANGVIIGIVFVLGSIAGGPLQLLLLILPHGVIELPTVIFSAGLGYMYAMMWMRRKDDAVDFHKYAARLLKSRGLWLTVGFIIAELSVAAYIEGEVTIQLASQGR